MTLSSTLDTRLRPTLFNVAASGGTETLQYTWNTNGNLATETISNPLNPAPLTQTFAYDAVNRLISASESNGASGTWNQKYGYDAYGNRSLLSSSTLNPYPGVTPQTQDPPTLGQTVQGPFANNRFTGAQYDNAGNIVGGAVTMTTFSTATYDAENRVLAASEPPNYLRYYYDGEGRRVMRAVCGSTPCTVATSGVQVTTFVYDAEGQLASEYGVPAPVAGTQYLFADHIGSTRALLSGTGTFTRCYDYIPFGGELATGTSGRASCYTDVAYPSANPEADTIKFTGKERDAETGLDFFGARYFSGPQGRFSSPDRPFADQVESDPQSWNMYAYVRNNPLRFIDLTGNDCIYANTYDESASTVMVETGWCSQKGGTYVPGTIDSITAVSNGNYLSVGYSAYNGGTASSTAVDLPDSSLGTAVIQQLGRNADASNAFLATFAGASVLGGAALYGIGAIDLLVEGAEFNSVLGPSKAVNFLQKVTNPKLRNIIRAFYRTNAQIGDGGTADAVTYTKDTGELVGGSNHIKKAEDLARGLANVLKDPNLGATERKIATYLLDALKSALK
jgi:RHS repeat-associated protein